MNIPLFVKQGQRGKEEFLLDNIIYHTHQVLFYKLSTMILGNDLNMATIAEILESWPYSGDIERTTKRETGLKKTYAKVICPQMEYLHIVA